jgi:hypothetical protein
MGRTGAGDGDLEDGGERRSEEVDASARMWAADFGWVAPIWAVDGAVRGSRCCQEDEMGMI